MSVYAFFSLAVEIDAANQVILASVALGCKQKNGDCNGILGNTKN